MILLKAMLLKEMLAVKRNTTKKKAKIKVKKFHQREIGKFNNWQMMNYFWNALKKYKK